MLKVKELLVLPPLTHKSQYRAQINGHTQGSKPKYTACSSD